MIDTDTLIERATSMLLKDEQKPGDNTEQRLRGVAARIVAMTLAEMLHHVSREPLP